MTIPTEPIGSIPRPPDLIEAMEAGKITDPSSDALYEAAVRDTMRNLEYKGVLQDYKFAGTNQSEVVININEIKDGKAVMKSSITTR